MIAGADRTETANRFCLTLATAMLAGAGIAIERGIKLDGWQISLFVVVGVGVSALWFVTMLSFRAVNVALHETVRGSEARIELALDPYTIEKNYLDRSRVSSRLSP